MRNKILFTLTVLMLMVTGMRAQTPYAVYCEGDQSFHFLCSYTKLSEGETLASNSKTITKVWEVNQGGATPLWYPTDEEEKMDGERNEIINVTTVVFEESFKDFQPTSCNSWFNGFESLRDIYGLEYLNTSRVTDMNSMFARCRCLTSLTFGEKFNTANVTNMSFMFFYCESLTTLNLNNFNTENVTDMSRMFSGCRCLTSLTFGEKFNTRNVRDMTEMFRTCENLTTLDLSNFNTENVTDMNSMFCNCSNLGSLDLSKLNTANVRNMGNMFFACIKLESLDLSSFNTARVSTMEYMFYDCESLSSLDLGSFDTENVTNMRKMFSKCYNLETIYVSDKFKIGENTLSNEMFVGCNKLNKNDEGYFTYLRAYAVYDLFENTLTFKYDENKPEDQSGVYDLNEGKAEPDWLEHKSAITKVVFEESFLKARPTTCYKWFIDCIKLTEIRGLENLNTENVTDMSNMFNNCWLLPSIDLSNFNTSNVEDMSYMFYGCESLKSLNLKSFDTSNVTNMQEMFCGCFEMSSLDLSKFNTSKVTNMSKMFNSCNTLRLLDLSKATIDFYNYIFKFENEITENVLIYVPEGTKAYRKNVVVGYTCEHFVIDDYGTTANNQLLLSVPYGFTAETITINREFTKGTPYTLYLPFAMNATEHGSFYTYSEYDDAKVIFSKLTDEQTTANTPYLFKPSKDGVIEITGSTAVTTTETAAHDEVGLCGVYEKKTFTEAEAKEGIYYGWAGGNFKRAGEGAKVDACRAYLKLPASNAPARLSVKFEDENTTGIIDIEREDSGTESPIYNLNGQRVGNSYRGVVIKNGKKIFNKKTR